MADINRFSMITPVQMINGRLEARLGFRTLDWLLANEILSNEREVETLSQEKKQMLLLSIYPDQQTILNSLVKTTT